MDKLRKKLTEQGLINLSEVEEKIFDEIVNEYVAGVKWTALDHEDETSFPPLNQPVLCSLKWSSGKQVYAVLKRVDEDDVFWRTVDDDSEIDYGVDITHWQAIDETSRRAGIGEK